MTAATDAAREALAQALSAIAPPHGVTALRAKAAIENALGEIESNLALLAWESQRVARVQKDRAVKAALVNASNERHAQNVARVEKRAR